MALMDKPDDMSDELYQSEMVDPVVECLNNILHHILPKHFDSLENKVKTLTSELEDLKSRDPSARAANSYAQMVGVMTQVKNGQEAACQLPITVLESTRSEGASLANYEALAESTPKAGPTTLGDLYALVTSKLNQPMKTAGVIWGLLSDDDRARACALYKKSDTKKVSSGKKDAATASTTTTTNPYIRFAQLIPKVVDANNHIGDISVTLHPPTTTKGQENFQRLASAPIINQPVVLRDVVKSMKEQEPNNAKICSILWAMLNEEDRQAILA